jgi:FdhD protein
MSNAGEGEQAQSAPDGMRRVSLSLNAEDNAEDNHGAGLEWGVAEEAAVEINLNGQPLAVTMASPTGLEDLAVGFVFTEGVVHKPADIDAVQVRRTLEGWIVDVTLPVEAIDAAGRRGRWLEGRSGCGLCGVDSLSAAMRRPPLHDGVARCAVSDAALRKAFAALAEKQPLNAATRSVHAAAWCTPEGEILRVCEDVGRHNALDKLAGWVIRSRAPYPGFVLLSSRVSYELVCKAAALGASLLAAVSAPTTLAVDLAEQADLPMAFPVPDNRIARLP